MEIEKLKERIEKKEIQITKIDKRINKWASKCTKDEQDAIKELWDKKYAAFANWAKEYGVANGGDEYELWSAYRDKFEAVTQLNNYKNALQFEEAKAGEEKIKVLMDFLADWKAKVIEYIENNVEKAKEYYKLSSEYADLHNNRWKYLENHTREEFNTKLKELSEKSKKVQKQIDPLTLQAYNVYNDTLNYNYLNKELDKDVEAKYFNMVSRVTKIVGNITDASGLHIGKDGNINGIIVGDLGKARLETIGAGGYNIQVYHFRLLVKPIR